MSGSIARRYAKALLEVARAENILEETAAELDKLAAIAADPEIGAALANPLYSEARRAELATTLGADLNPTTRNFVRLLGDQKRLDQIVGIADQYRRLLDNQLGRVRAVITSSTPLEPGVIDKLIATFTAKTGKHVLAETVVDESQLGGVIVDIEGKIYDGSLRTQLRGLAASIAGGRSAL
jgi:F-type H+-transporting ATPase subunit delta